MFNAGLSLDQAPPISVILRFFLTLPLFGIVTGLLMFSASGTAGSFYAPAFLALVHAVLFGTAAMAMTGALFQMLPVLAGAVVKNPLQRARTVHLLLLAGAAAVVYAFATERYAWLGFGALLGAGTLGGFALMMLTKLRTVQNKTAAVKGMIFALVSLLAASAAALAMGLEFGLNSVGTFHEALRQTHLHFMLFGWIFGLIVAVSLQVVEMFYVTPPYPGPLQRLLPVTLFTLLGIQAAAAFVLPEAAAGIDLPVGLLMTGYAGTTLLRLSQRKRPLADTTVQLWRTGMAMFLIAPPLYFADAAYSAALAFGYGVLAVIYAMSYKIVPFLVWFHLNGKGVMECPMMGDVIPAKNARYHLQLFWSAGIFLAFSLLYPDALAAAGALFVLMNLFFAVNLFKAAWVYYRLKDKGMF